ncbi:hypothetical protein QYM36_003159 [Artemia franciscana]|uniref:Uncharacterized protein n=2 Tax=Artemia franciscana TaxID=6661 RepID=A0AA88L8Z4_ARTSF|nr:hypothetical protein QYM36_003159 [Artemia franciscana]
MKDKGKSDAEKLAAAALSIRVGGFQDPEDLPGFSHFLEHMVFMGSEKYKSENEFDDFVTTHGGNSNAHTACEETVFVFDVLPKYFEGALDRFAQFFISPLLLKDSMERELRAVDSEFEMAVPSDSVRKEQILQSIVPPGHPVGKFMWGNSKSIYIANDPDGSILNQRLNEYRQKYYLANRMNLVLQSRHTLDELEEIVRKIFSAVPSGPEPPGLDYSHLPPPFDVPEYNKIYKVAPVKDLNEVELRWALPTLLAHYK